MSKSEMAASVTREDQFDDELSLLDLVAFVRRNFSILLATTLIGGVLGGVIAFSVSPQWEASALVRVGQLGNVGNIGNVGNVGNVGSPIELPLQLVDRIKSKSFQNDVLKRLGLANGDDDATAKLFRETLKVKLEKSELLRLALRGASADAVKSHLSAVVNELKEMHGRMSAPTINRLQQELATIELELKRASLESERLRKSLDGAGLTSEKILSQAALVGNLLLAREGELHAFRERKRAIEEQLSLERTFPTDVLGRIEVSSEPVFPKKSLFIVVGLFIGLFLGVFVTVIRAAVVKERVSQVHHPTSNWRKWFFCRNFAL
ncbi:MAG: Wzz/FepE/Etk N-terminal domain-containing protein [Methylotenera sp.]|nr:Wzz/FepE/Etk N-terminal domain-containing protein [Methylotenera sp.]